MYTEEMLESIKKVEAKRAENAAMEPRRMVHLLRSKQTMPAKRL